MYVRISSWVQCGSERVWPFRRVVFFFFVHSVHWCILCLSVKGGLAGIRFGRGTLVGGRCIDLLTIVLTTDNFLFSYNSGVGGGANSLRFSDVRIGGAMRLFKSASGPTYGLLVGFTCPSGSSSRLLGSALSGCFVTTYFNSGCVKRGPRRIMGRCARACVDRCHHSLRPVCLRSRGSGRGRSSMNT